MAAAAEEKAEEPREHRSLGANLGRRTPEPSDEQEGRRAPSLSVHKTNPGPLGRASSRGTGSVDIPTASTDYTGLRSIQPFTTHVDSSPRELRSTVSGKQIITRKEEPHESAADAHPSSLSKKVCQALHDEEKRKNIPSLERLSLEIQVK